MAVEDFSPEVVDAREVGMNPDRLQRVKKAIENDTAKGTYDGAVFVVARHGKVVIHEAAGKTDLEKGRQAKLDDVFVTMSVIKQPTAVRVLMAVEGGRNDRVSVENVNETHYNGIQGADTRGARAMAIHTIDGAVEIHKGVGQTTHLGCREIIVYPVHLFGREIIRISQNIHTNEMSVAIIKRVGQVFC